MRTGTRPRAAAVQELRESAGIRDDLEDLHPPTALGAAGHVDGEDPGQQIRPTDAARTYGHFAEFIGKSWDEPARAASTQAAVAKTG